MDGKKDKKKFFIVFMLMILITATKTAAFGITDPNIVLTSAPLPLKPVGIPFLDPVFNTTLQRVSNISEEGGFETQIYSQLQAFSPDNKYLLLDSSTGFIVRRMDNFSLVGLDTSGWNAPRWYSKEPHVIIHFDSNDDAVLRLQLTDLDTLTTTTIYTFPAQYEYILASQSFDELSRDGRWLAGMVTRNDGEPVIFSLDVENLTLGAQLVVSDLYNPDEEIFEPDWVGVSPLGNYLVVQWVHDGTTPRSGLETFDIQTGAFIGRVSDHHNHGDMGVDSDGETEFFMTTEISSPQDNNRPAISMRLLPGTLTASEPIYLQVVDWQDEDHISCQGPNGVGLISWGNWGGVYDWPFENELFLQYTDGSVLRLAHHRSSKCGYWVQPRASISRDGRYVVFSSDWSEGSESGMSSCGIWGDPMGKGDPYIIDLAEVVSCDLDGNEKDIFVPGENVYVKAKNIGANKTFKIWIQDDPANEGMILNTSKDPSLSQEVVTTNKTGSFGPIIIWNIPPDASVKHHDYDIVLDKQNDRYDTGKFNAVSDGIDSTSTVGFTAPVPEIRVISMFLMGLIMLFVYIGYCKNWEMYQKGIYENG